MLVNGRRVGAWCWLVVRARYLRRDVARDEVMASAAAREARVPRRCRRRTAHSARRRRASRPGTYAVRRHLTDQSCHAVVVQLYQLTRTQRVTSQLD